MPGISGSLIESVASLFLAKKWDEEVWQRDPYDEWWKHKEQIEKIREQLTDMSTQNGG